jgi:hypothetical protein
MEVIKISEDFTQLPLCSNIKHSLNSSCKSKNVICKLKRNVEEFIDVQYSLTLYLKSFNISYKYNMLKETLALSLNTTDIHI